MKKLRKLKWIWLWSSLFAFVLFLIYTGRFNPYGLFDFMAPAQDDMKDANSVGSLVNGLI